MSKNKPGSYAMKLDSVLIGIDTTRDDLEFLCSLAESPDNEYGIPDAVDYAYAIVSLHKQLDYLSNQVSTNQLSEDGELLLLTEKEVVTLSNLADEVEDNLERLRECGISLKRN